MIKAIYKKSLCATAVLLSMIFGAFANAQHSDIWLTLNNSKQIGISDIDFNTPISNTEFHPVDVDLTTGKYLFSANFSDWSGGPKGTPQPGFQARTGTFVFDNDHELYFRVVGLLWFWNGYNWVNEVIDQEVIKFEDDYDVASIITTVSATMPNPGTEGLPQGQEAGFVDEIEDFIAPNDNNNNQESGGNVHKHLIFKIENLSGSDPASGAYMIDVQFYLKEYIQNGGEISIIDHPDSEPVRIAFNYQLSMEEFDQAISALTSPVEASVPIPFAALYVLAILLFIFSQFGKAHKTVVK